MVDIGNFHRETNIVKNWIHKLSVLAREFREPFMIYLIVKVVHSHALQFFISTPEQEAICYVNNLHG